MSKRTRVPAVLHAELTEYSSLLRALRTSNTLDVTSHLVKPIQASSQPLPGPSRARAEDLEDEKSNSDDDDEGETDDEGNLSLSLPRTSSDHPNFISPTTTPPSASGSRIPSGTANVSSNSTSRKRKREVEKNFGIGNKGKKRDTWTRWPLLAGDVTIPEWTLEDEIGVLAAQILKARSLPSTLASGDGGDKFQLSGVHEGSGGQDEEMEECEGEYTEDGEEEQEREQEQDDCDQTGPDSDGVDSDLDAPSYIPPLTATTTHLLSTLFGLLAQHTPLRAKSLQNRIEPMDWRSVLEVLSVHGDRSLVDQRMLENAEARLRALYPPEYGDGAISLAGERASIVNQARQRFATSISASEASLFELVQVDSAKLAEVKAKLENERANKRRSKNLKG